MITKAELVADIAKLQKSIAHDKQNIASADWEIQNGGKAFLRKHERELEITEMALKALEAGLV